MLLGRITPGPLGENPHSRVMMQVFEEGLRDFPDIRT
jgi:hypothetical protein